ncbi:MlaD family protein [Actinomycetospora endophytica]|uniref:MlaD family protein n=1 Tax=Actinomycetospora endophytica TaxID=2291215 RepID=A0ABS8P667_9PSEU|nr:MlaD family protein [Actinomycetospora endophytica]MCD2193750.1 MlaD family protein [Actinomycetospora endophytica]
MKLSSALPGKGDGGNGKDSGNGDGSTKRPNVRKVNYALVGTIVVAVLTLGLLAGITKSEWQQYLQWGFTTRDIHTTGDYFTLANSSKVKVGGVEVGRIDSVEREPDGSAVMHLRIESDVPDKVGSAPSANVRPVSLLGGVIYVDIIPGGDRTQPWTDDIPVQRTQLPTELSQVVQGIQPDAVKGIPASINGLDRALKAGSGQAIQGLAKDAPAALGPGAGVIDALQGTNPGNDLPAVVDGLQRTTAVLSRQDGQIESVLTNLHTTTSAFRDSSKNTVQAIHDLPDALDTARPGLARLGGSLDKLRDTAGPARPVVQQAGVLLDHLDPVLVKARPVVSDLRAALEQTRPVVQGLIPASKDLTTVFNGLNTPLDRVNGPIVDTLESGYSPNQGADAGRRHADVPGEHADKLREEIGPMFRGLNGVAGYNDANGHGIAFNVGGGTGTIAGNPGISLPTLYALLNPAGSALPMASQAALPAPVAGLLPQTGGNR